jgi:hypothetical protein
MMVEKSTSWYPVLVNGNSGLEEVSKERTGPYRDHAPKASVSGVPKQ